MCQNPLLDKVHFVDFDTLFSLNSIAMKYIKLWLVILFLGLLGTASAQITFFEGTFEDAMAKAKKEKKNLFVDFYADWCEPCKTDGGTGFRVA